MHIITERRLKEFVREHPDSQSNLSMWAKIARQATWNNLQEVRADWPTADAVGILTVFNICGNKYRLIVAMQYARHKIYIRHIVTHAEYSKGRWKHDPWY